MPTRQGANHLCLSGLQPLVRLILRGWQEIDIYCDESAEGALLCLTAGVAKRNLRRRNPTQYIGVEDVEQCCATSRHIFMAALFPQATPLCGLPAVKHSLPSPMALLCHGIPTSARDLQAVFSRILFSVKYLICWVCNRSAVVGLWGSVRLSPHSRFAPMWGY